MKKSCLLGIGLLLILGLASNPLLADVVLLSDDFDNEGPESWNYNNFQKWTVTDGSVDLLGPGGWNPFPAYGKYVDLDGSTLDAGRLISKTIFALTPGIIYTLKFDLAGSQWGDTNTVDVSLGSFSESFTLDPSAPFTTYSRNISLPFATSAQLIFDHRGGDNKGLLLDNVQLSYVPLPGAVCLLGSGLVGLLGWRAVRRKS